jgi:hypothetical protein
VVARVYRCMPVVILSCGKAPTPSPQPSGVPNRPYPISLRHRQVTAVGRVTWCHLLSGEPLSRTLRRLLREHLVFLPSEAFKLAKQLALPRYGTDQGPTTHRCRT